MFESEEKHLILRAASRKQLQKTLGQLRRIALESQTWLHDAASFSFYTCILYTYDMLYYDMLSESGKEESYIES